MIVKAFAVYDDKASTFAQPFFCPTRGLALRSFEAAANDANSAVNKWPADFKLFEIGEYDDQEGELRACKPEFVCTGSDVVKAEGRQEVISFKEASRG